MNAEKLAAKIRKQIYEKLPPGTITPEHTAQGHFYRYNRFNEVYPSVTGKLAVLKDPSIVNFRINRNNDYIFANYKKFTAANIMEHLDTASRVGEDIRDEAGSIGTTVHDIRQEYFEDWIKRGIKPSMDLMSYIPKAVVDPRIIAALRAINKFVNDVGYVPIVCELYLADEKFKVGGTLDDIGLMFKIVNKGSAACVHKMEATVFEGVDQCSLCKFSIDTNELVLVLMDLKTSNQFKDHYFFQVGMYYYMFKKLTGIEPEEFFILKTSKKDGTYKREEIRKMDRLVYYAKNLLRVDEGLEFVSEMRKDNQKKVSQVLELKK